MNPEQIEECISRVQDVSPKDQARCLMLAVQRCKPRLRAWCENQGLEGAFSEFFSCFLQWENGNASDAALEQT